MNPIRAAFFDADGTLLKDHSMSALHSAVPRNAEQHAKEDAELHALLDAYQRRQRSFAPYMHALVLVFQERLRGAEVYKVERAAVRLAEQLVAYGYMFTRELLAVLIELGVPCFLISGGPEQVISRIADRLGFTDFLATTYPHSDGLYTGEDPTHWIGRKREAIELFAERHDIDLTKSIGVGDTAQDVPMLEAVGIPLCFNPVAALYRVADQKNWVVVRESRDLIQYQAKHGPFPRHVATLGEILPEPISSKLTARLACALPE